MNVGEIQKQVLTCLRQAQVRRVIRSELHSISGDPADEEGRVGWDSVFVIFIADRDEFESFQKCANSGGLWLHSVVWNPFTGADLFEYRVIVVERHYDHD